MNPIYRFQFGGATSNLLNPFAVISGTLNTTTGAVETSSSRSVSAFIEVETGNEYVLMTSDNITHSGTVCYYRADKSFISGEYGRPFILPSGTKYIRVSFMSSYLPNIGVFQSSVIYYEPYGTYIAHPLYSNSLAKSFERESNQQFFRPKLSGSLQFVGPDYNMIVSKPFDYRFVIEIDISYNAGQSWASYWRGTFWKTDCKFDDDSKIVSVTPTVWDQYNDVLAGMDKEYNLIELAPEIIPVKADKRPMIQVYVPGQTVIGCFLSGMWWEQECEAVNESDTVEVIIEGQTFKVNKLEQLCFTLNKSERAIDITHSGSPTIPNVFAGVKPESVTSGYEFTNGAYKFKYTWSPQSGYVNVIWEIIRISDNVTLWIYGYSGQNPPEDYPMEITLSPVEGTGVTGDVTAYIHDINVYSRFICDTPTIIIGSSTLNTREIPADDIVENNRNYHRMAGYYFPDTIYFSTRITNTPNQWGIYQPGQYYQPPYLYWDPELFPVARNAWGNVSIWFTFSMLNQLTEESARQPFTINHAYPLASVLSVLLAKIASGITHAGTTDYSQFLYGQNLIGITQTLLITPKSNIVSAGYDQPAQKAPITLKNVLDMLRDCFRCYWFIDSDNKFRIEHISYFMNGGAYPGTPDFPKIGINLTQQIVSRNGKEWSFAANKYQYDKPEMAARYQFGWMDDVTQLFEGYPIDIISQYVNPDNIEQIEVSKFTSDIDYILLNPAEISKDGFVLLAAQLTNGEYKLPYVNFDFNGNDHILQNAWVAFIFLQQYYAYDMPAPQYEINGEQKTALGTKKLKLQELNFPALHDPDLLKLVKTNLGDGAIEKLSINLSSRNANATLKHDTE